jgi:hypothetical protein
MSIGSVGAAGAPAAGTTGGIQSSPQTAGVSNIGEQSKSSVPSADTNISITNNVNNTQTSHMSTEGFMELRSGCQSPMGADGVSALGGAQEGGLDVEKLLEMMMVMMMMKMMQELMGSSM